MFLLDSDIAIWILRKNKLVTQAVEELLIQEPTGISTITIAEIYKNVFPHETGDVEALIARQSLIVVSPSIARQGGQYWQEFNKNLKNLNITDCIIAATAKEQKAKLVTLNTRHFPMKDILVINPLNL